MDIEMVEKYSVRERESKTKRERKKERGREFVFRQPNIKMTFIQSQIRIPRNAF